jgi:polyisoprenoid-binding protein YceI
MKKFSLLLLFFAIFYHSVSAQLYQTRTGFIGFYSKTPLEDIKAENNQVYAVIDTDKKNLAFSLLLKGFVFTKELMQEHFNENYVESDKYPKATFTGSYTGDVQTQHDGVYKVVVKGNLTLHHITKAIEVTGTLEISGTKLNVKADFKLMPEDFAITIPGIVRDKIDKEITVHVLAECNPSK